MNYISTVVNPGESNAKQVSIGLSNGHFVLYIVERMMADIKAIQSQNEHEYLAKSYFKTLYTSHIIFILIMRLSDDSSPSNGFV